MWIALITALATAVPAIAAAIVSIINASKTSQNVDLARQHADRAQGLPSAATVAQSLDPKNLNP